MSDDHDLLRELAAAHNVATEYWDWRGNHVRVDPATLLAVLAALGVDATTDTSRRAALEDRRSAPWRRVLPPYVVARAGQPSTVDVHVPHGTDVRLSVVLEDGTTHPSEPRQRENRTPPLLVDGTLVGEATFDLPGDLPPGYHRLRSDGGDEARLIVPPAFLGLPARLGARRAWGLATQLYSVRSRRSWGLGDLTDLADLATWAGAEHGADFVLVNPLHAAEPAAPIEASPYLPVSRRYANPIYLRVERVPEYADLDADARAEVDRLRGGLDLAGELIDRDAVWTAKRAALSVVRGQPRSAGRELAYRAYLRREGAALDAFATWCALSETHGADWHDWPEPLRHPASAEVARFAADHADAVEEVRWLQWTLDEQFAGTQSAARRSGMALGVVHDLAVGVSKIGADSWSWQDELARGITVGAPPDPYAQTGQDWNQPPWRPDRMADLGYAPFRELMAAVLRHSGGLRVDHIIGLFRLWWIPAGAAPTKGTYVRYDHDALIAILMLEAARTAAVVIGEDLGTVEPWVRDYLSERGLLGTSVLWFENDWDGDGKPLWPDRWRELCLASVTTHDLPPTAGYLAGDHVRLRDRLGLLTRSLEEELAADRADQDAWLGALRAHRLLGAHSDPDEIVVALHRALAAAPSRLRCLALTDAVGDRRTQNQPGSDVGHPNWRVPLTGPDGRPVLLEDVLISPRAAALAETMRGGNP